MYSVLASRIGVLILSVKDEFPRGNVFVKFTKVNLEIWDNEAASFVKKKETLQKKVYGGFDSHATITV